MKKIILTGLVGLVIGLVIGVFVLNQTRFGGTTNLDALALDSTLSVGTDATIGGSLTTTGTTTNNGIAYVPRRSSLTSATTTPCSILSPAATSTLVRAGLNITTATSTNGTWYLATSTTAYATTTNYYTFTVSSGSLYTFDYISSTTSNGAVRIFAPSTYLNFAVSGASGFTYGGTCDALFKTF